MNATLKQLRRIGQPVQVDLSRQATKPTSDTTRQRVVPVLGSYGRGIYAGQSTYEADYDRPGSYGRGSYAGGSTADLDFGAQGSFASGV
jgi:hypothetical protein